MLIVRLIDGVLHHRRKAGGKRTKDPITGASVIIYTSFSWARVALREDLTVALFKEYHHQTNHMNTKGKASLKDYWYFPHSDAWYNVMFKLHCDKCGRRPAKKATKEQPPKPIPPPSTPFSHICIDYKGPFATSTSGNK